MPHTTVHERDELQTSISTMNFNTSSPSLLTVKFPCPGRTILIDKVMVCLLIVVEINV